MLHRSSLLTLSLSLVVTLAACGSKKDAAPTPTPTPTPTPGSAAPTPTPTPTPTPGSAAPTPHPSQAITAIVEGSACAAGLQRVTDVPLTIDGTTARFTRSRGGGCPTKPVYTLLYTKASPTELRVCDDPTADTCEMYIQNETVTFDLSGPLKASGATAAVVGK